MPPFGFRKRERSASPSPATSNKKRKTTPKPSTPKRGKPSLFETVDAVQRPQKSLEESRKFLADLDGDEDDSASSEADSDDFEDVPPAKRHKKSSDDAHDAQEESEDDGIDWEDAIQPGSSTAVTPSAAANEDEIGDVSISMNDDGSYIEPLVSAATGKKGPSKRERHIRVQTHCLHVMSLMWHNSVRNSWINDKNVQKILVDGLPPGVNQELQRWQSHLKAPAASKSQACETPQSAKGKGKAPKKNEKKNGRDWNKAAQSQEPDAVQTTNALLRLLKVLTAYWRKRFTVTAPGLRKSGYKDLRRLRNEIKAWNKNMYDAEEHGERLENVQAFRNCAKECEGSRDVGAQLFVALLRGLGLEARLVASLQPAGFGWSKAEEAHPAKAKKIAEHTKEQDTESDDEVKVVGTTRIADSQNGKKSTNTAVPPEKLTRKSTRGNQKDPIKLDDSDSPLSDAPSEFEQGEDDEGDRGNQDDDLSVIDITPSLPKKKKPHKKFDRDLAFPIYWAEVCDPSSNKYFPVDPVVLSTIASTDELLQTFEPRGKKAEVSKQVICYVIAFSADGTAKDVTVRYLKRHQLPGKTKGVRMPAEKVPIYNRKGKVKRYEDYDWFRTVISSYDRPENKRTVADDLEDQADLKPFKAVKGTKVVEKESLQGYKQSADFVLEQHFRREEALKPGAKPVKTFTAGKGDKAVEHPVYLRDDVVVCKTVESWHKEGRAIRVGEQPLKYVPVRAVTLIRKREMEDAQRETGEKLKQGLYSIAQTEWIIPDPIQNGVIPKNAFGNMDVYVPTMVPRGAVHLPLKGTAKLCRKLQIDYAEACTGFEFGKQRAVPILTGVVVAQEHKNLVKDAWRAEQAEQKRKEDTKRTATALHWWRKMLLGLRVLERMRVEYKDAGGKEEEINPFVAKARREGREHGSKTTTSSFVDVGDDGGGFLPDDYEEDPSASKADAGTYLEDHTGGFLLDETADEIDGQGGGFMADDEPEETSAPQRRAPISLQSMHQANDSDQLSDGDIIIEAPAKKPASKKKAQLSRLTQPKPTNKRPRKIIVSEEDDGSSLSDLDTSSADDSNDAETAEGSATGATTPSISARNSKIRSSSPQVIVTPINKSVTGKGRRSAAKKVTPVRSPYFDHGDSEVDMDGDEEDDEEVVKPRRTTARTMARK